MASIGLLTLHLHINDSTSLKDKRRVLRALKDRLRGSLNVSVAELEFQDTWQRSVIGVVSISSDENHTREVLQRAEHEAARMLGAALTGSETELL